MPRELVLFVEVVKNLSPIATAIIAFMALRNWQRQEKAKRQAEFLDAMIETAQTYIAAMPKPLTMMVIARIGMSSHAPIGADPDDPETAIQGAIVFMEKHGVEDGKRLLAALEDVQPSVVRLRSLVTKGQVFKFKRYAACQEAVATLVRQFGRIESFTLVFGAGNWNWENAEVRSALKGVMAIDPENIRKSLGECNAALIEFATDAYKQIYG